MGPLRGSGVRALRRDSRATKPSLKTEAVEPRNERISGKGWSVCGRESRGEYIGQTGGNEGASEIGAEEIHVRRGQRINLGHISGNEVEKTGGNEGEGNREK